MWQKKLKALFHPERYQGWGKTKKYFEGWYYKVLSADEQYAFAFIPGIAMDHAGTKHAFIQTLDGKNLKPDYVQFKAEDFVSESNTFKTVIADNTFELNRIGLNLPQVKGELHFKNSVPWPKSWYSPGIMGPYSFMPLMECYHSIVSLDHELEGILEINAKKIDFTGGRGYVEKDWGHSFPSAYIWVQSNHFSEKGISLVVSVAKIPWWTNSFVGFIAGLYFNCQLIQFTTYNATRLKRSYANRQHVELVMENRKYRLEVLVHRHDTAELASPLHGIMDGRISESMTSTVEVKLINKRFGETVLQDIGRNTGLEVAGKLDELLIG